jgi:hypothetical protein
LLRCYKHRNKPDNNSDNISKQSADQSKISENFLDISKDSTSTNNSGVFKNSKNSKIESTYDRVLGKGMGGHTHQLKNLFVRPSDNPIHVILILTEFMIIIVYKLSFYINQ